jgi:ectoine hydroxylase-related dioxygenase (phytanoyl-CoA dioxygenase family)
MAASESSPALGGVRSVTTAEVAFYQRNGWVYLPRLVSAERATRLLTHAKALMGEDATTSITDKPGRSAEQRAWFRDFDEPSLADPVLDGYAHSPDLGKVASDLMGSRPVRFFQDQLLVKAPAAKGGGPTTWHHDMSYLPLDRNGVAHVWLALVDVPPEKGSMRFLDGSHLLGLFGRSMFGDQGDLTRTHPEMFETQTMSPPLHLSPGDATVHDASIAHYAPPNETDEPRWAYLTAFFRADALYTGAEYRVTKRADGLEINKVLDHPRFPIAYPA